MVGLGAIASSAYRVALGLPRQQGLLKPSGLELCGMGL